MTQWVNGSTVNQTYFILYTFAPLYLCAVMPFKFGTVFAFTQKTLYEKNNIYFIHSDLY